MLKSKVIRALGVVAAGILGVAVLAGCGASKPGPAQSSQAQSPYVVGFVSDNTGGGSSLGQPELYSANMAAAEINAAGGINGHPLKLVTLDAKSDSATAVLDFKQIIQNDKPIGLIGDSTTGPTMAAIPEVTAAQIPLISMASDLEIIQPVAQRHWIFKVPPPDTLPMQVILNYLKTNKLTKIAFVYENIEYGTGALADLKKIAPAQGFRIVDTEAVDPTATDATTQLTRMKAANPQAVIVWAIPPLGDIVTKSYSELGLKWPILYSDGMSNNVFLTLAGPAVNGSYIASTKLLVADQLPASDPQKAVLENYINKWNAQYAAKNGPANMFGGFGYDAVYMFKDAIAAAGSNPTPASVRDALENLSYNGVTGVFHITPQDHNGLDPASEVLIQVLDQKWHLVPGYHG